MNKKIAAICAAAILANVGVASATDTNVLSDNKTSWGVEARYFHPDFDGTIKTDKLKLVNTNDTVGFKDDLGFDNGAVPEFIVKYKNMSVDWVHLSSDGKLTKEVRYDGDIYAAGGQADTTLDYIKFKVENDLGERGAGVLKWNYGITVIKANISGSGEVTKADKSKGRNSFDESFTLPLPAVGLKYEVPVGKNIGLNVGASGMTAGGYGYFYDIEAGLSYTPSKNLYINAGYRDIKIKGQNDNDEAIIELKGPYLGMQFKF